MVQPKRSARAQKRRTITCSVDIGTFTASESFVNANKINLT
jgi:hypothetical protein